MAASKSTPDSKKRRYTYAERTVTAISDIRRHHPRSPIHLKTLNAQIRRNAEAQNDLLGPRWRAGVNLACKLLADQGILDPEHPPGRIVLTPKGKQLIAGVRHSVGLPSDHEHNEECDENLGRKVIRRLSYPARRVQRATSVTSFGDEDDLRKAPSKMIRAEASNTLTSDKLLEENKKLRAELASLRRENARKLAKLKADLREREKDLLEYRGQTSRRDETSSVIMDVGEVNGETSIRNGATTTENVDNRAESVGGNGDANNQASHRPHEPLVRTNTGSFISNVSKRPTPAPSDAGTLSAPSSPVRGTMEIGGDETGVGVQGPEFDLDEGMDTTFDADVTLTDAPAAAKEARFPVARAGLQTHTPTSSPPRALRRQLVDVPAVAEHVDVLSESVRLDLEKKLADKEYALKAQDSRIRHLEGQLSDRSKLEEELRVLREQLNTAVEKQKSLQEEKDKLQENLDGLQAELLEKTADLENIRDLLQQKDREAEAKAKEAQKARQNADQNLRAQLRKAQTESESIKTSLQETIKVLEKQLTEIRESEGVLSKKAQEKQDECERLQAELQVSLDETSEIRNELESVKAKLDKETTDRTRLEAELVAAQEREAGINNTLNSLRDELQETQSVLQIERGSANKLHQALRESVGERDQLLIELEAKQTALLEAQSTLKDKEAEIATLQDQFSSSEQVTADLRASLATLKQKLQNSNLLTEALEDAEEEVTDLKRGYERLKRVHLAEFEKMDERVSKKRRRTSMPPLLAPTTTAGNADSGGRSEAVASA